MQAQQQVAWMKSALSESRGMCVEVASLPGGVGLRHSVTPEDGALLFTRDEFAAFLDGAKRGEFDHLI
ncbi:DUF397 domain-containing protein [Actinomycetospora corticicola]|uniref:DUF397 domain-containing protein n=1 Tax=Actinomycetospora corticicola TaxID=663602 RepID=A0A7Y9E0Q7_9PSEU|nr:DUF397 domain-containing protein [Actinomycetospora corticicola]NYD38981.1 hypothetical protein [Actinomycetospora corticicola]